MTRLLAQKLTELDWIKIVEKVETNIIFYKIIDLTIDVAHLSKYLVENGVYVFLTKGISRFVIHHYIREPQVETLIALLKKYYDQHKGLEKK